MRINLKFKVFPHENPIIPSFSFIYRFISPLWKYVHIPKMILQDITFPYIKCLLLCGDTRIFKITCFAIQLTLEVTKVIFSYKIHLFLVLILRLCTRSGFKCIIGMLRMCTKTVFPVLKQFAWKMIVQYNWKTRATVFIKQDSKM